MIHALTRLGLHSILSGKSQAQKATLHCTVRVQNESPQNMPPWHADYFELKTIEAQKAQEELFTYPLTA